MLKNLFRFLLFTALGLGLMYWIFQKQKSQYEGDLLSKLYQDTLNADFFYVFLTVLFFMTSNVFRALRWHLLLEPLGIKPQLGNSLSAIMVAYLTNLAVPRAGEIARASVISKQEHLEFDKALGTVLLDRLIDVICLLVVAIITFVLAYEKIYKYFLTHFDVNQKLESLKANTLLIGVLMLVPLSIISLVWIYRKKVLESSVGKKVIAFIRGMLTGINTIFSLKRPWLFLMYSIFIWTLYFLMAFIMFKAIVPTEHLGPIAGLVVFFFGSLGIVFPAPGGMGSYHFLAIESLSLYQISSVDAFTYANLSFFTIQIFTCILFGGLSFVYLAINHKR